MQRLAELVERQRLDVVLRGSACAQAGSLRVKAPSCEGAMVSGPGAGSRRTRAPSPPCPSSEVGHLVQRRARPAPCRSAGSAGGPAGSRRRPAGRARPRCRAAAAARAGADARELQELRRADRARAQHHLARAPARAAPRRPRGTRRRRARPPSSRQPRDLGAGHDRAGSAASAPGAGSALAALQRTPALLVDLEVAAALVVAAVEVVVLRDAGLRPPPRGRRRGSSQRSALLLDPPLAAGAVVLVRAAPVVLGAA